MPEYIEREALRAEALRLTCQSEFAFDYCFPYWQFSKCINEAPAADVETVRHGKWLSVCGCIVRCDLCRNESAGETNYCPYCGALMGRSMTDEEAIKGLQNIVEYWTLHPHEQECAETAISALRERIDRRNDR